MMEICIPILNLRYSLILPEIIHAFIITMELFVHVCMHAFLMFYKQKCQIQILRMTKYSLRGVFLFCI